MKKKPLPPRNPLELALFARFERYRIACGMKPTTFGIMVCNDPNLLKDISDKGRRLEPKTLVKAEAIITDGWEQLRKAVEENQQAAQ